MVSESNPGRRHNPDQENTHSSIPTRQELLVELRKKQLYDPNPVERDRLAKEITAAEEGLRELEQ